MPENVLMDLNDVCLLEAQVIFSSYYKYMRALTENIFQFISMQNGYMTIIPIQIIFYD